MWIPVAIMFLLKGSWVGGLILAAWSGVVVGSIDNVLPPMFVGNRLCLHTIPAFISITGGLLLFGAPGFILGSLAATMTMTMTMLQFWTEHEVEK